MLCFKMTRSACGFHTRRAIAKEERGNSTMSGGEGLLRKRGGQAKRDKEN